MKKVYLDNASTTAVLPEVIVEMTKVLTEDYGNPSSSHSFGRNTKNLIEISRKSIAKHFSCNAQEIVFTSGATEANNFILLSSIRDLKVTRIITSRIEHHAVLHTLEILKSQYPFEIDFVELLPNGNINYVHLNHLLTQNKKTLVSLMHVNNEIGTVLELTNVSKLCKTHNALFHTDAVQSIGKTVLNLNEIPIDFLVGSAHKFHGPKGIGFAYIRKNSALQPILLGGEQEKGLRAGTESVHNIVGMAVALDFALTNLEKHHSYVADLKNHFISQIKSHIPNAILVGNPAETFYTIQNVILPFDQNIASMLIFQLDMNGIAVSRGSACQSGSSKPSHVLAAFLTTENLAKPNIRISFSHYNTKEEIDYLIEVLKKIQ